MGLTFLDLIRYTDDMGAYSNGPTTLKGRERIAATQRRIWRERKAFKVGNEG